MTDQAVNELLDALKPFAREAERWDRCFLEAGKLVRYYLDDEPARDDYTKIVVGDLRRAAEAYAKWRR